MLVVRRELPDDVRKPLSGKIEQVFQVLLPGRRGSRIRLS